HIGYAESHDQALVGDKTISFWLMDKEMYQSMNDGSQNLIINNGVALHKLIRLIVLGLGGESYLNFIGNEWGHPEWLDFPNLVNNESFHYARRLWHLVDDPSLKYKFLNEFDKAMIHVDKKYDFLSKDLTYISRKHNGDKIIVFKRPYDMLWIFNFNIKTSFPNYRVGINNPGKYKVVLNSDNKK
ncbi:hypothetical protein A3Q56_08760, partial [Intoshia linei]